MPEFLTRNKAFGRLLETARRAARTQAGIFITGESGTGKNRLAGYIHEHSPRHTGPLIQVPCANLPVGLLESELFGHEPGAFTGAGESRPGRFELADGGSLYLDEIQELTLEVQAKVLRAIQEKQFERLGGNETLSVDVRIIASSQEDPERMVDEGRLRSDLFYRMNVVRLHVPPLRERTDDIPGLAAEFLALATERHNLTAAKRLAPETLERLVQYPWPGNVRELVHALESATILSRDDIVQPADLPASMSVSGPAVLGSFADRSRTLAEVESAYIDEVLARTGGNKSAAARILGIHRKTLHEKLRR
ncbi:MAG: sigma-54-dependent Fis family transcriptional regulator [Acidobacteria bacterium]|uniref:Sigma-54-dependent Fis family transcriptional regulator n=1 Tax=Candidatus Polarisedimenticola svalbardensis TaxID=2886004 RepID=A0A8J6Y7K9_9BACT|nr:sigma-54-dependent Fis family transcriptional regulator [Candidatus Polarisedimenticola svalbardensis]